MSIGSLARRFLILSGVPSDGGEVLRCDEGWVQRREVEHRIIVIVEFEGILGYEDCP